MENVETQVANNVQMQGFVAFPFTNSEGCKEGKRSSNPKRLTNPAPILVPTSKKIVSLIVGKFLFGASQPTSYLKCGGHMA
jgi:hypothetical protein